jgi:hypothetical protein
VYVFCKWLSLQSILQFLIPCPSRPRTLLYPCRSFFQLTKCCLISVWSWPPNPTPQILISPIPSLDFLFLVLVHLITFSSPPSQSYIPLSLSCVSSSWWWLSPFLVWLCSFLVIIFLFLIILFPNFITTFLFQGSPSPSWHAFPKFYVPLPILLAPFPVLLSPPVPYAGVSFLFLCYHSQSWCHLPTLTVPFPSTVSSLPILISLFPTLITPSPSLQLTS